MKRSLGHSSCSSRKMTIKPVSRIEDVLKTALEHDPYTFMPTTSWLLKDKSNHQKVLEKERR